MGTSKVRCQLDGATLEPTRFGPTGREHRVAEVLDRWPGEGHEYFKVRTTEDDLYILRLDTNEQTWEVSVFKERQRPDTLASTVD
jgi:hypothetical protein